MELQPAKGKRVSFVVTMPDTGERRLVHNVSAKTTLTELKRKLGITGDALRLCTCAVSYVHDLTKKRVVIVSASEWRFSFDHDFTRLYKSQRLPFELNLVQSTRKREFE